MLLCISQAVVILRTLPFGFIIRSVMETDTETSLQYLWDYMVDYHAEFGLAHSETERAYIFSNYDALLDAYIDLGGLAINGTSTTETV